jgi:hypothetical protein
VVFRSVLADGSIGLYGGFPNSLAKVVRTGDEINVGTEEDPLLKTISNITLPNATSTSSGGGDGRTSLFNDSGILLYNLSFTDGSSGVFTSDLSVVPEPATCGLAAFAGLTVCGWVRRRRGC